MVPLDFDQAIVLVVRDESNLRHVPGDRVVVDSGLKLELGVTVVDRDEFPTEVDVGSGVDVSNLQVLDLSANSL